MKPPAAVDVSICIVTLNCREVLDDCLRSIRQQSLAGECEVIVIDNASTDGTSELVARDYPEVRLVSNGRNIGFTKATNQAIELSHGRYVVWLNPDTILRPDSLARLHDFLERHAKAGIAGPKVLNADGSFQPQCRRGLPTPSASLFYLLKLHRLQPHSRSFGRYLSSYLPVDEPNQVDAVSGCCLFARREVWDAIGPLDEAIPGFGEDLDWCVRAHNAGWQVWYRPESEIVHLKGQGGAHSKPYHKAWGIHMAMWVFYRKHLMGRYPLPLAGAVWLGIWLKFLASIASVALRQAWRGAGFQILRRRTA